MGMGPKYMFLTSNFRLFLIFKFDEELELKNKRNMAVHKHPVVLFSSQNLDAPFFETPSGFNWCMFVSLM